MISVIIPTYNEEKAIGDTIKRLVAGFSADAASPKPAIPYEIIITDDKSTDNTVAVARTAAAESGAQNLVIILAHETKHATIAQNRNAGAKIARGDLLVFMDSDCVIENMNESLTHAISLFEKDPKLVALTGKLGVLPEFETWGDRVVYFFFNLVHFFKNNIFHTGEASGKFQMITHNAFLKVNGYREDLVTREDADMFWRLLKVGRTYYDSSIIVRHTGRRAHKLGWPKLLSIWMIETFWVMIFNKSRVKIWKDIR